MPLGARVADQVAALAALDALAGARTAADLPAGKAQGNREAQVVSNTYGSCQVHSR